MAYKKVSNQRFDDARIVFRNFSGTAKKFNAEGARNFCVVIEDEERAQALINEGWNVKQFRPRDDEEEPRYYIPVAVDFDGYYPPNVYIVTGKKPTPLNEENVGMLDNAEYRTVDLIIRPYCWELNGKEGVKAYLKTMYVTLEEDELSKKYNQPDEGFEIDDEDVPF